MTSRAQDRLRPGELAVVGSCLLAALDGPYFPDWEFRTIMTIDRDELREMVAAWPDATVTTSWEVDAERVMFTAVNNVLNNLIGYPHGEWDRLSAELGVGPRELADILGRWRGDTAVDYSESGYVERLL